MKQKQQGCRWKAKQYVIEDGYLYKKSYLSPLLRCIGPDQSNYLIREVHEGICGTHSGPRSVVTKLMNLGYYWPTMHKDTSEEIHKCEGCQLHAPIKASTKHDLVTVTSAWPFYKWGMDIVGPFPEARGRIKFLLVAVDYFTKWPEVKPLASITGKQVERMNWSIVSGIKTRHGKEWLEELPSVLRAIRTTEKTSHGRTPYSLVFDSEAVIPAEIGVATRRISNQDKHQYNAEIMQNLDLPEEA
ncbi:hypothetical protein L1987_42546 [Smallanthus sonchifolius]|uniref:Uncharacterized protein n=1 Tax=Smallanthus sonchifolius TaxID=185202 RepID=A0ACB9GJW8_9ASTR|nr:hypothetical protein L1987_42546 [Smallanthus sonchifolius]